ncbi:uncharacterized protein [Littorina saxatilis]|uniref:DUF8117 domain-containing protein n=1 Tax=Littorina saxatilis TaxID=31220 RepID=A0AAN9BAP6_9CAEN
MRKIRLSDTDAALFDEEMLPQDYEFLARHKDTFCRMWMEQGRTFWRRYLEVFRSYIVRYSLLGDLPCDIVHLEHALEHAFKLIEKNFVEGKANQAKAFLYQIADLGRNRHKFGYLDSKSVSKDPFYTKDTRDLFRDFFGQAKEKSSYIRVYLLTPVYMRFGGSIVRSLVNWKDADEIDPSDESYYTPPLPIEYKKPTPAEADCTSVLCPVHLTDCDTKFYQVALSAPHAPIALEFWTLGDPRFEVPENPLYDPTACRKTDWREGLTMEKFSEWYCWCIFSDIITKPENQCADCRARRKAKKRRQKKKKKNPASLADFGYDDESIMADSGASWDGLGGGSGVKALTASGSGDGHHKDCPHADPCSKFALLDTTIAVDVSDRFKKKSQCTQTNPGVDSSQQTSDAALTSATQTMAEKSTKNLLSEKNSVTGNKLGATKHCCSCGSGLPDLNNSGSSVDPSPRTSINSKLSKESEKGRNRSAESQTCAAHLKQNGPSSTLPMAERVKQVKACFPVFSPDCEKKSYTQELLVPIRRGDDVNAYFDVHHRTNVEPWASEVDVVLSRVANAVDGSKVESPDTSTHELGRIAHPELTSKYLSETVDGFPRRWLCAESDNWCAVEIDYSFEEKEQPTYFILKVSSSPDAPPNLNLVKDVLIKLLWYIVRRKKRPSAGWVMKEGDVFPFCMTLSTCIERLVGLSVLITARECPSKDTSTQSSCKCSKGKVASDPLEKFSVKANIVNTIAAGMGAGGVVLETCPKVVIKKHVQGKRTHKDEPDKPDTASVKNSAAQFNNDKPLTDKTKPKPMNGAIPKSATTSKKDNPKPGSASATAKKHSESQVALVQPVLNGVRSVVAVENGVEQGKKKKKKSKNTTAVVPAAPTTPSQQFPLSRTTADNLALSNAKTQEELAQIIARMASEGKVDHLSQTCISSTGAATGPPTRVCGPLPIMGGGDASQPRTGERLKSRCAYCGVIEPALRTYKKCLRCKEEVVPNARYYCGRPCQMKDWKIRHNLEHQQQMFL